VAIRRRRAAPAVTVALVALAAAGTLLVVHSQQRPADPAGSAPPSAVTAPTRVDPARTQVVVENRRPGTAGWRITRLGAPEAIQGWADQPSAATGQRVRLHVSTTAPRFRVKAYRMGWYGGHGARLVWRSEPVVGRRQPPPTLTPQTNMVATHWRPSLTIPIGPEWPPGVYLLKLVAATGQRYVPLTVRDDTSRAALVVMNPVTTWQAYNTWGGRNQYVGPDGRLETRSRVVSFDRPTMATGPGSSSATSTRWSGWSSRLAWTSPTGPTWTCTATPGGCSPTAGWSRSAMTSTGRPGCAAAPRRPVAAG
jgi:hypothetical protein